MLGFSEIAFVAFFFFAFCIQSITGFAGNMLVMPTGMQLVGMSTTIVILNVCCVVNCGQLAFMNRASINKRELAKISGGMLLFMLLGIYLDAVLPLSWLVVAYGLVVLYVGVKNLVSKKSRMLPEGALWVVLALAGLMQGMFVSGGAFLVIYAVQKLRDKDEFRSTLSALWCVLNIIYAAICLVQGKFTPEVLVLLCLCVPLGVIATITGNKIGKKFNQAQFVKFVYVLLVFIGLFLLFCNTSSPLCILG